MKNKKVIQILVGMLFFVMLSTQTLSVFAKESFRSYTYGNDTEALASPDAVYYLDAIDSSTCGVQIGSVTDLFYYRELDSLFAVDQSNSQIVEMKPSGELVRVIQGFENQGMPDNFQAPTGIFVNETGIYVADTANHRIVHLAQNGELIRIIESPESTILGENFEFQPTHIALDSINRLYVIATGFNQGVLCLDENGKFLACMGSPEVTFDFVDYLWKRISTDEQKERLQKFIPTEYNNISIDEEDFAYVTCSAYTIWDYIGNEAETLKKLNAKGQDILRQDNGYSPRGDRKIIKKGDYSGGSVLVDSIPLDYGMFCAIDSMRGRVFVYNELSQLLFEFGVRGTYGGCFDTPTAVEYVDGKFYVADSAKCNISVFQVNSYGERLIETSRLHRLGDYEAEELIWSEILTENNNSMIALKGLANVEYRNGDYADAMEHYRLASDTEGYAKAFKQQRSLFLNEHIRMLLAIIVLIVVILIVLTKLNKRRKESDTYRPTILGQSLEFGRKAMFRPMSGYWDLTWEHRGTMSAATAIFVVVEVIMLLEAYATGYIFAGESVVLTNPITVIFKMPLLLLLYSVCNWCVTSLMDGKARFKQIWMANCYALMPLIFLLPPAIVMSNFITLEEGTFYHIVVGIAYFWVGILLICANKQIHDYEFGKSLGVLFITILGMVMVVFLAVLCFAMMQQMYEFVTVLFVDVIEMFERWM